MNFKAVASSKCQHNFSALANYKGVALTTGSFINDACYVTTELYNFTTGQWSDAPDYPFHK